MGMLTYTPVEFNYIEILAKTLFFPARQNPFIQKNTPNAAAVHRIAVAMNTNYEFTRSCIE